MRTAGRLNVGPLAWMALGALLAALVILGPRVALNRALDLGYSLGREVSALF